MPIQVPVQAMLKQTLTRSLALARPHRPALGKMPPHRPDNGGAVCCTLSGKLPNRPSKKWRSGKLRFVQAQGQDPQRPDMGSVPVDGAAAASSATTSIAKPQAPRRAKLSANARTRSNRTASAPRAASAQGSKRPAATTKQRTDRVSTSASATAKPTGAKPTRSQSKAASSKTASAGAPSATPTAAPRTTKSATRKRV